MISYISSAGIKARRVWSEIFQALRVNNCKPKLLDSTKVPFKNDGEIKVFQGNQK